MTTTYTSTHSRPCAYCRRPRPEVFGHALDCIDVMVTAILVPVIPGPDVPNVDTLAGGLTWTGVMRAIEEAPESHAEPRSGVPRVPVWSVASVFLGLVLMAVGFVLNAEVAAFVWGLTR